MSKPRSVSIVTFANLGTKRNIPTADIEPVVRSLAGHGVLDRIICQVHAGFSFPDTVSAVPVLVRVVIRLWERVLHLPFSRRATEDVFDFFARFRLRASPLVLFHRGYFLPRTLEAAHAAGACAVDLVGTAHLEANVRLEEEENARLGLSASTFRDLDRGSAHYAAFDYIIAMSDFARATYVERGYPAERAYVAHPDIDTKRFTPAAVRPVAPFTLLYLAYTTPLKGLHYLLDAWEQLDLPDARLRIVGGFGDLPELLRHDYEARIARHPQITAEKGSAAPEDEYRAASAFVFPSLTEGFGRVTLEAMACGLPVITTENARGIVEDGKTGFVVPIRDAHALKEKIAFLYHHPDVASAMGAAARAAVEAKEDFGEAVYAILTDIQTREAQQKSL